MVFGEVPLSCSRHRTQFLVEKHDPTSQLIIEFKWSCGLKFPSSYYTLDIMMHVEIYKYTSSWYTMAEAWNAKKCIGKCIGMHSFEASHTVSRVNSTMWTQWWECIGKCIGTHSFEALTTLVGQGQDFRFQVCINTKLPKACQGQTSVMVDCSP